MRIRRAHLFGAGALALALSFSSAQAVAQYGPPPPPQAGYGPGGGYGGGGYGWDAPPAEFRDVQRQGFRDGVVGAQRDVENRRAPNVNNRDEFRHPNVPHWARRDYRDGFRRGYDVAMSHMLRGGYGPRPY